MRRRADQLTPAPDAVGGVGERAREAAPPVPGADGVEAVAGGGEHVGVRGEVVAARRPRARHVLAEVGRQRRRRSRSPAPPGPRPRPGRPPRSGRAAPGRRRGTASPVRVARHLQQEVGRLGVGEQRDLRQTPLWAISRIASSPRRTTRAAARGRTAPPAGAARRAPAAPSSRPATSEPKPAPDAPAPGSSASTRSPTEAASYRSGNSPSVRPSSRSRASTATAATAGSTATAASRRQRGRCRRWPAPAADRAAAPAWLRAAPPTRSGRRSRAEV